MKSILLSVCFASMAALSSCKSTGPKADACCAKDKAACCAAGAKCDDKSKACTKDKAACCPKDKAAAAPKATKKAS